MDGTRLATPYRFTFRVRGPTLITGSIANRDERTRLLSALPHFEMVWSAPVDLAN